jgi:hypothetical protein
MGECLFDHSSQGIHYGERSCLPLQPVRCFRTSRLQLITYRVGLDLIAFYQPAGNDVAVNKPTKQYKLNMKKIILSCIAAAGLLSITGCSTDKPSQSETTTTQQTTVPAPVTTTTTDTKTQ